MILEPKLLDGKPLRSYDSILWTDDNNTLWIVYYTAPAPDDVWIAGFELGLKVIEAHHFSATFCVLAEDEIEAKLTSDAQAYEADHGIHSTDNDRGNAAAAFAHARRA